jgi:hypothetical protein
MDSRLKRKDGLRFVDDYKKEYDFFWDYSRAGKTDFSI